MLFALAIAFANGTAAQNAARLDPGDPKAATPAVTYRSALEGYRPFAEQELAPWRRANDEVGAAGRHKGHAPAKPPAHPEAKGPAEKGHGGHK